MHCRQDLQRMQKPAEILSSEEVARLRHEAEAALEGQRANAQARKERMLKVYDSTFSYLLKPSATFCNLQQPSVTFSNLL